MRAVFPRVLEKHLNGGTPLMILLGDIGVFGFRNIFAKHPDRILNLGILEQASVGLAAGFSMQGFLPVFHSIAPFLVERSFEQLKIDFGYQRLTGIFVSAGGSFDYSRLGGTHHCPADVNLMLNIPGFTVCVPGTADELSEILDLSIQNPIGAVYIFTILMANFAEEERMAAGFAWRKGLRRIAKAPLELATVWLASSALTLMALVLPPMSLIGALFTPFCYFLAQIISTRMMGQTWAYINKIDSVKAN